MKIELMKEEFDNCRIFGGLSKSHKIIRTPQIMELQFKQLCAQIELNEKKRKRSEGQRNERNSKRHIKFEI